MTPHDSDYEDSKEHFNIGSAFHDVLETTKHTRKDIDSLTEKACVKYNVKDKELMIRAMVNRYLDMHEASGWTAIECELKIESESMIGYIDIILQKGDSWAIGDLKTAAAFRESTLSRIGKDYQLNLYSSFKEDIADHLRLKPERFVGCFYRVTTKPRIKQNKTESDAKFYQRLSDRVESYDVYVPVASMDIEGIAKLHQENHDLALELHNGLAPCRNYSNCEDYFTPCPWWSQCHGEIFTKCKSKIGFETAESYKQKAKDTEDLL
jgi:hypothetical protein